MTAYALRDRPLPGTCERPVRRREDAPLAPCGKAATHDLIRTTTGEVWPLCCACAAASAHHHGLPFPVVTDQHRSA